MKDQSQSIVEAFEANLESVTRLSNFDGIVIEYVSASILERDRQLKEVLKSRGMGYPERFSGARVVKQLEKLRENEALRSEYSLIFNQCIVLLVSYFASSLHDLFRYFFQARVESENAGKILTEGLKVSFGQLQELDWDVRSNAADLFLTSQDISFQDMKSVYRSFKQWLGFGRERDLVTDRIIVAQAARHCIVHAGGVANERTVGQTRSCKCDDVLPGLTKGVAVATSPSDISIISQAMKTYINELRLGLLQCV
jgi:hypothetical protein